MAGKHVEGAANSHDEGDIQIVAMGGEKPLLARGRHADEQAVGATVADFADDIELLFRLEVAVPEAGKAEPDEL